MLHDEDDGDADDERHHRAARHSHHREQCYAGAAASIGANCRREHNSRGGHRRAEVGCVQRAQY